MSCSKLSKAMSLSSTEISGSLERIACIDSFRRSASLGPPKRAERASGLMLREGSAAAEGSEVVDALEFVTPHFRSSLSPGSILKAAVNLLCEDLCTSFDISWWGSEL